MKSNNEIGSSLTHRLREPIPQLKPMLALVLVVFALAYGTHRLIERPASRLLRNGLKRSFAAMHTTADRTQMPPRAEDRTSRGLGGPGWSRRGRCRKLVEQ